MGRPQPVALCRRGRARAPLEAHVRFSCRHRRQRSQRCGQLGGAALQQCDLRRGPRSRAPTSGHTSVARDRPSLPARRIVGSQRYCGDASRARPCRRRTGRRAAAGRSEEAGAERARRRRLALLAQRDLRQVPQGRRVGAGRGRRGGGAVRGGGGGSAAGCGGRKRVRVGRRLPVGGQAASACAQAGTLAACGLARAQAFQLWRLLAGRRPGGRPACACNKQLAELSNRLAPQASGALADPALEAAQGLVRMRQAPAAQLDKELVLERDTAPLHLGHAGHDFGLWSAPVWPAA